MQPSHAARNVNGLMIWESATNATAMPNVLAGGNVSTAAALMVLIGIVLYADSPGTVLRAQKDFSWVRKDALPKTKTARLAALPAMSVPAVAHAAAMCAATKMVQQTA